MTLSVDGTNALVRRSVPAGVPDTREAVPEPRVDDPGKPAAKKAAKRKTRRR